MASRLTKCIKGQVPHKLSKSLTTKTASHSGVREATEEKAPTDAPAPGPNSSALVPAAADKSRYEANRHFASSSFAPITEVELAKRKQEIKHMQPALLPEFFAMNNNSGVFGSGYAAQVHEHHAQVSRQFTKSKTVSNVTLPLKITRMANPFPEPVKMMESQTVSDSDKREQMWAEAKQTKLHLRKK